ncbi:MAG: 1-deoxy-D-xylulose-5-phosphate reductoisomerase [Armatimonadetes bacterium]|nr:1-deoxy-D-xylulose-5-phosphate reductoisomerase [Armatimonadota bacterium]MDE2207892.1 1-deoxy-D-xylulose-5-phosphate reductoisomerase [Armatimonadota bacterium]
MKRIAVLGSTGSIGKQTLDVVDRLPGEFAVTALAAHRNVAMLAEQAARYKAEAVCIGDPTAIPELRAALATRGWNGELCSGVEGLCQLAALQSCDLLVMALAGAIGIRPTHAALSAGKDVALASKEVLVAAGESTMALATQHGARIVPIDSEHSAILQCIEASPAHVERIILTCSGGPFRTASVAQMAEATLATALNHPTWQMGGLVTVNSATLMNKALEIIEAHWLFGVAIEAVDVVIHPQSIVHSFVQFRDGSVIGQLGLPDMRLPIQLALTWPRRINSGLPRLQVGDYAELTFHLPRLEAFPALNLARCAANTGGTMPAVMNAANEAAVELFCRGELGFLEIVQRVEEVMSRHTMQAATLDNVLAADAWARLEAQH